MPYPASELLIAYRDHVTNTIKNWPKVCDYAMDTVNTTYNLSQVNKPHDGTVDTIDTSILLQCSN